MAERILYVPSVGFCMLLVFALTHLVPPALEQQWSEPAQADHKTDKVDERKSANARLRWASVAMVVAVLLIGAYSLRLAHATCVGHD